eukprot:6950265-Heterocapsa_arctica.AAC.1
MIVEGPVPVTQEESIHVPVNDMMEKEDRTWRRRRRRRRPGGAARRGRPPDRALGIPNKMKVSHLAACPGFARKGCDILDQQCKTGPRLPPAGPRLRQGGPRVRWRRRRRRRRPGGAARQGRPPDRALDIPNKIPIPTIIQQEKVIQ